MFGRNEQRHIDLHLPTSWNRCTTEELEAIAAAIINEQQRVDRYHPFDWQRVKLNVVLAVNNLHVVSKQSATDDDSDSTFIVNRSKEEGDFPITTGQLLGLTERLSWIDDEKADKTVFLFPYPKLDVPQKSQKSQKVQGPPPLLDGYTWREYRWLTDWMQEYMRLSNARRDASSAQREFLAVLFCTEKKIKDEIGDLEKESEIMGSKFPKEKQQRMTNLKEMIKAPASLFADFSPVRWQVILFWWSSLMNQLAKKFPKVFKTQPVGKHKRGAKPDTPWDFYNRVTAMLADEYKSSEADQQNETYSVTLQKLENVAEKAAEMEKIKAKK